MNMNSLVNMCNTSSTTDASKPCPRLHHLVGEKISSKSSFIMSGRNVSSSGGGKGKFRTCSLTGAIVEYRPSSHIKDYMKIPSRDKSGSKHKEYFYNIPCAEKANKKSSLKTIRRFTGRSNSNSSLCQEDSSNTVTTDEGTAYLDDSLRTISNDTPAALLSQDNNKMGDNGCLIEYSSDVLVPNKTEPLLSVSFGDVDIYEFPRVVGDNPSVTAGAPVAIGVQHISKQQLSVEDYEVIARRQHPLTKEDLKLNSMDRLELLRSSGATMEEIMDAKNAAEQIRLKRAASMKALIQKKNLRKQKQAQEEEYDVEAAEERRSNRKKEFRATKLVLQPNDRLKFSLHGLGKTVPHLTKGFSSVGIP